MMLRKDIWLTCALCIVIPLYASPEKSIIHTHLGFGFFAEFRKALSSIIDVMFNDTESRDIEIDWSDQFFPYKNGKGENGWDLFFSPIGHVENRRTMSFGDLLHDQTCLNKWLEYEAYYPYRVALNIILHRYIKINQIILDEVNALYNTHMHNKVGIGVHVRFASAHGCEKPGTLGLQDYFNEIDALIALLYKPYVIYLATDSRYVIHAFKNRYNNVQYNDCIRSNYMEEIHLITDKPEYWFSHPEEFNAKKPGYRGGKDVLIDCLLLSKCQYLIHTTSNVADFVSFFNPEITSIFVPRIIASDKKRSCYACTTTMQWCHNIIEVRP